MRKTKTRKIESAAPRIEIGSPEMDAAFKAGVENYIPTAGGHEMAEEGGVTSVSLKNLRELCRPGFCGPVKSIELGKSHGVLVRMGWGSFESYLATGFAWGYRGEGPHGLAVFASEQGCGTMDECLKKISETSQDWTGILFLLPTQTLPKPVFSDGRCCFGISWFATEAEADEYSKFVQARGDTYNGGWYHGMPCGRDKAFDCERDGKKYFAVTER